MMAASDEKEEAETAGDTPVDVYARVKDLADPNRCQANIATGQCMLIASPGRQYCILHGGKEHGSLRNYRLTKWQARVEQMANSNGIKSLRDEIGILRMMLEERMNMIGDVTDMMMQSHTISDLVLKIEKVVLSCHKIERSMGDLIDKSDIINMVGDVVAILEELIEDKNLLASITERIEKRVC